MPRPREVETLNDMRDQLANPIDRMRLAEKLLRVRNREGNLVPLVANEAQRSFELRSGRQNIVLKARQVGITTWVAARFFLRTITRPGTLTLQVAHTREAAQSLFTVVQRMYDHLPEDLRQGPLKRSRSNIRQMVFPGIDSEFSVASAAELNAGRGLSVQNLHCSEVARWPGNAKEKLAGLRAALSPSGELVLESTPNGAYGAFYDEWSAALDATTHDPSEGLIRHFLPWWLEPAYIATPIRAAHMSEEEQALVHKHALNPQQIGFRRSLERSYGGLRSQEFAEDPETCFRATGACCFEIEAIEARLKDITSPQQSRRGGALHIWWTPIRHKDYILSVDTAGGGRTGDFVAIQVIELSTGLQCAELQQRISPSDTASLAAALAREYGDAIIAVERNNHGAAVLAFLTASERYTHLYQQNGQPGWLTTSASRPEMIARLSVLLSESPQCFTSRRLLGECRTFIHDERGRAAAANGAHDDLVLSMAIAQSVRAELLQSQIRYRATEG